jgi:glycosyltransferase involved in cell wall biosynthesis
MTKKIAIIYAGAKYWGGVETYLENIFEYADKQKVELHFISIGEWELAKKIPNSKFQIPNKWSNFKNIKLINNYLKQNGVDLVVSQGMVGSFYARLATLFTKIPNLIIVHSDWRTDYSGIKKFIFLLSDRSLRLFTLKYITVSEFLKSNLVDDGINPDKVTVIYNGVDICHSREGGNLDPRNESEDDKTIVIGSIGRLHSVKNYENLIRACAQLKIENWKLTIIGEGSERPRLERLISGLGLGDKVELVGAVDNAVERLSQMDIYIQPSLSEGFGLSVVEAMAAGLPVVVTPYGALPELVDSGKAGLIAKSGKPNDLAAAISEMLNDKVAAKRMGRDAAILVKEKFGIKTWADRTIDTYIEACEK